MTKTAHLIVNVGGEDLVYPEATNNPASPFIELDADATGLLFVSWRKGQVLFNTKGDKVVEISTTDLAKSLSEHPINAATRREIVKQLADADATLPDTIKKGVMK